MGLRIANELICPRQAEADAVRSCEACARQQRLLNLGRRDHFHGLSVDPERRIGPDDSGRQIIETDAHLSAAPHKGGRGACASVPVVVNA